VRFVVRDVLKMMPEDYIKELGSLPKTDFAPFDAISTKIIMLRMYIDAINKNPNILDDSFKKSLLSKKVEPAILLYDYIILEIRNFYRAAHERFGDTIKYPPSAELSGIVKEFRDNVVGHMSLESPKGIVSLYEKLNEYGFVNVYNEWITFRDFIFDKLKIKPIE
jgi:hypothetical protein